MWKTNEMRITLKKKKEGLKLYKSNKKRANLDNFIERFVALFLLKIKNNQRSIKYDKILSIKN